MSNCFFCIPLKNGSQVDLGTFTILSNVTSTVPTVTTFVAPAGTTLTGVPTLSSGSWNGGAGTWTINSLTAQKPETLSGLNLEITDSAVFSALAEADRKVVATTVYPPDTNLANNVKEVFIEGATCEDLSDCISDTNFAQDDLTLDGTRTHDFDSNDMSWTNVGSFSLAGDEGVPISLLLNTTATTAQGVIESNSFGFQLNVDTGAGTDEVVVGDFAATGTSFRVDNSDGTSYWYADSAERFFGPGDGTQIPANDGTADLLVVVNSVDGSIHTVAKASVAAPDGNGIFSVANEGATRAINKYEMKSSSAYGSAPDARFDGFEGAIDGGEFLNYQIGWRVAGETVPTMGLEISASDFSTPSLFTGGYVGFWGNYAAQLGSNTRAFMGIDPIGIRLPEPGMGFTRTGGSGSSRSGFWISQTSLANARVNIHSSAREYYLGNSLRNGTNLPTKDNNQVTFVAIDETTGRLYLKDEASISALNQNFANTNLTLTGARIHQLDSNWITFQGNDTENFRIFNAGQFWVTSGSTAVDGVATVQVTKGVSSRLTFSGENFTSSQVVAAEDTARIQRVISGNTSELLLDDDGGTLRLALRADEYYFGPKDGSQVPTYDGSLTRIIGYDVSTGEIRHTTVADIVGGFADTTLFSENKTLTANRTHAGGGFNFTIDNLGTLEFAGAQVNLDFTQYFAVTAPTAEASPTHVITRNNSTGELTLSTVGELVAAGGNYATADLTLTGARSHDFDSNTVDHTNVTTVTWAGASGSIDIDAFSGAGIVADADAAGTAIVGVNSPSGSAYFRVVRNSREWQLGQITSGTLVLRPITTDGVFQIDSVAADLGFQFSTVDGSMVWEAYTDPADQPGTETCLIGTDTNGNVITIDPAGYAGNSTFFNTNLTQTANRTHNMSDRDVTIQNVGLWRQEFGNSFFQLSSIDQLLVTAIDGTYGSIINAQAAFQQLSNNSASGQSLINLNGGIGLTFNDTTGNYFIDTPPTAQASPTHILTRNNSTGAIELSTLAQASGFTFTDGGNSFTVVTGDTVTLTSTDGSVDIDASTPDAIDFSVQSAIDDAVSSSVLDTVLHIHAVDGNEALSVSKPLKGAISITSAHNGLNVVGVQANVYVAGSGAAGSTQINLIRNRGGVETQVLSSEISFAGAYFAANGTIDNAADDLQTGDLLYAEIVSIETTEPSGLVVAVTLGAPAI